MVNDFFCTFSFKRSQNKNNIVKGSWNSNEGIQIVAINYTQMLMNIIIEFILIQNTLLISEKRGKTL